MGALSPVGFFGELGAQLGNAGAEAVTGYRSGMKERHDYLSGEAVKAWQNYQRTGDSASAQRAYELASQAHQVGQRLFGDQSSTPDLRDPVAPKPAGPTPATPAPLGALAPSAGDFANGGVAPVGPPMGLDTAMGSALDPKGILGQTLDASPPPAPGAAPAAAPPAPTEPAPVNWGALSPRQEAIVGGLVGAPAPKLEAVPYGGTLVNPGSGKVVYHDEGRYQLGQDQIAGRKDIAGTNNDAKLEREKYAYARKAELQAASNKAKQDVASFVADRRHADLVARLHAVAGKDPALHQKTLVQIATAMAGPKSQMDFDGTEHAATVQRYLHQLQADPTLNPQGPGGTPTGAGPFPPPSNGGARP